MNNKIVFLLIIFLCVSVLYAKGNSDSKLPEIEVTGRVRLVGSSLFTSLVISTSEKEWYIEQKDQQKLWQCQQQIVTVKGKEYYQDLTYANGTPAGRQYFLKDIKIISP